MSDQLLPAPGVRPVYADLIGKPYMPAARGPQAFDCYGLTRFLAARSGLLLPDYDRPETIEMIADRMQQEMPFWEPCRPGPGAVVAFYMPMKIDGKHVKRVSHVGTVIDGGWMVHTWEGGAIGVCRERYDLAPWSNRVAGFYRFAQ